MTPVEQLAESYRGRTLALAEATAAAVKVMWERSAEAEPERFAALAGALTASANVRAVRLADRYAQDALTLALRRPVLTEAADVALYARPRLIAESYLSIVRDDGAVARIARVARSEPLAAGHARMDNHARRGRWVRVTSPGACRICSPRSGETIDPSVGVSLHTSCTCTTSPA